MTDERMALVELLQKSGDGDFLRAVAEAVLQILMEADVERLIGAGRHERSADRPMLWSGLGIELDGDITGTKTRSLGVAGA